MTQVSNPLMEKMLIKKAVGEGVPLTEILENYGHKDTAKALLNIINTSPKNNEFYIKCLKILIELEPTSKEEYPELWI